MTRLSFQNSKPFCFLVLICFCLIAGFVEAKPYSMRDLRKAGFTGTYLGAVNYRGAVLDTESLTFIPVIFSSRHTEKIPVPLLDTVVGPSTGSAFFLSTGSTKGNDRRVRIISTYSGTDIDVVLNNVLVAGSGSRILSITKRGEGRRARFFMSYSDRLDVRSTSGNALGAYWDVRGNLKK